MRGKTKRSSDLSRVDIRKRNFDYKLHFGDFCFVKNKEKKDKKEVSLRRKELSKSGSQSVFLRHVDLDSAGTYRCEVSAEAPEFQTVEAEKEMKVLGSFCSSEVVWFLSIEVKENDSSTNLE
ncbi:hypothetical protein CDAR_22051 [Caerostris darwini]|uniref:Immunoglobulin V-set domain-containing protein n=1 Tax=Caerostris darwini TaxID=1538125 RepID=A0AAV4SFC3_9ARAC|nr:hypothetical protein CDAR_22051 [Caerostris darwini]